MSLESNQAAYFSQAAGRYNPKLLDFRVAHTMVRASAFPTYGMRESCGRLVSLAARGWRSPARQDIEGPIVSPCPSVRTAIDNVSACSSCTSWHDRIRSIIGATCSDAGVTQIFACALSEIVLYSPHPVPLRGRFAIVTDVGCGMRWAHWGAAWACSRGRTIPVRRGSRVVLASRC